MKYKHNIEGRQWESLEKGKEICESLRLRGKLRRMEVKGSGGRRKEGEGRTVRRKENEKQRDEKCCRGGGGGGGGGGS